MEWAKREDGWRVPVKSWCANLEQSALEQAANLAKHPAIFHHVALMPDAHAGYGMPIGGVAANSTFTVEECDKAMEGIVCERWQKVRGWKKGESVETSQFDLSESPMAYKDIENVMNSQKDLVGKCVRLVPLACLKG